ncbi:MAG: VWA domain-containing protein [Terriglobia bacterium]
MRRAFAIVPLLALALALRAQAPSPPSDQEDFRLRVAVELVTTPLVVRDASGEFVYDLSRQEISLRDNGVPQQLVAFELASQPLSLVLLLDTSKRVEPLLEHVRKSGVLFTDYIMGQFGEAAVITFDRDVTLHQEFTSNAEEVIQAVKTIRTRGDETRLNDALDQAVRLLRQRPEGRRRVIIAVTEPRDHGSSTPTGLPLRYAQLADISVYTISLSRTMADLARRPEDTPVPASPYPPGVFPGPAVPGSIQTPTTETQQRQSRANLLNAIMFLVQGIKGTVRANLLEVYAQGTGGLHYGAHTQAGLEAALNRIGQDLHSQYLVSYRPSNRDRAGFHRIEISVSRPGVRIRTRPGYYISPPL